MYLHNKLVELGFEVTSIVDIKNVNKGCIYYERDFKDSVKAILGVRLNGEVTLNELIPNQPRNLIFKISYFIDDDLITEYLKKYVKDYEEEISNREKGVFIYDIPK